ncbi:MAG: AI-2E family transporter [Actinobacteria bacterium]|nr:AI-2E family transporter [Actinomycetota bacterium]
MRQTVRRAFVSSAIFVGVVVLALALWKIRLLLALLFFGFIIAAAMRPGVAFLHDRLRIPRIAGILLHYAGLVGLFALLLYFVVPTAKHQIAAAVPTSQSELNQATKHSKGIKHEILRGIQKRLKNLPSARDIASSALDIGLRAFEIAIGIFFIFASAAYWIFERDRAERVVLSLLPRPHRKVVRDTWNLIDLKLGAFVRGQLVLVGLVATVLSLAFWAVGLKFWLLVGIFAGLVELIPVVGPLAAGAVAVGVGFTDSWQKALVAGLIVLVVRLLEDYVVIPKILGEAVGLTPLTVLFSVAAVAWLFGGFAIILAIPLVAVLATIVDVLVFDKNPAEEEVPSVLFPAKEAET